MIFQCLGITGAILLFYGMIALTVTQVSSWFLWTLLGTGVIFIFAFVLKALSRAWQKIIILFLSFNAVWILFYAVHDYWSKPALTAACVAVTGLIAWVSKKNVQKEQWISSIVIPLILTVAFVVFREKVWVDKIILISFLFLNLLFLWVGKSFLAEMFQKRSMRYGTSAAIYSIIVGFILIVINIGSQDFHKDFDFTADRVNTLSEQTVKVINELSEPIHITAFFEGQSPEQAAIKATTKNLLDRYHTASKNIDVLFADPDKEKILASQKHAGDGDIVVEYKQQSHITKDPTEQGITQAILKVTRTDTPAVCFTSGHGEMGLDDPDDQPRSISILKASLNNEGYEARTLNLESGQIPSDCSVVIIPSPQQRFPDSEVNVFDQYLSNGGKLIALLDPLIPNTNVKQSKYSIQQSGFETLLKKWGIKLGNNLMLEKHLELLKGEIVDLSVRAINYGNHPVVDSLKSKQTYFSTVQSVQKVDGYSGTTYELIKSAGNAKSWAETNIDLLYRDKHADPDAADIMGPVTIAMASEKETPKKTQLLVFGDGDFISNALIQSYEFNYDLFLNSLNWMSGDVQRISIRPKKIRTSAIELSPEDSYTIFYLAIITLPMLVLIFGINLWWIRRRRG